MKKLFVIGLLFVSFNSYFQEKYVTDKEFQEKITWLLPNEEKLPLKDVLIRVPGQNKDIQSWEVDGILYQIRNIPSSITSGKVKYVEVIPSFNNVASISKCNCSLIIKTIVTEKQFNSRKNILHRLNKKSKKK